MQPNMLLLVFLSLIAAALTMEGGVNTEKSRKRKKEQEKEQDEEKEQDQEKEQDEEKGPEPKVRRQVAL